MNKHWIRNDLDTPPDALKSTPLVLPLSKTKVEAELVYVEEGEECGASRVVDML